MQNISALLSAGGVHAILLLATGIVTILLGLACGIAGLALRNSGERARWALASVAPIGLLTYVGSWFRMAHHAKLGIWFATSPDNQDLSERAAWMAKYTSVLITTIAGGGALLIVAGFFAAFGTVGVWRRRPSDERVVALSLVPLAVVSVTLISLIGIALTWYGGRTITAFSAVGYADPSMRAALIERGLLNAESVLVGTKWALAVAALHGGGVCLFAAWTQRTKTIAVGYGPLTFAGLVFLFGLTALLLTRDHVYDTFHPLPRTQANASIVPKDINTPQLVSCQALPPIFEVIVKADHVLLEGRRISSPQSFIQDLTVLVDNHARRHPAEPSLRALTLYADGGLAMQSLVPWLQAAQHVLTSSFTVHIASQRTQENLTRTLGTLRRTHTCARSFVLTTAGKSLSSLPDWAALASYVAQHEGQPQLSLDRANVPQHP